MSKKIKDYVVEGDQIELKKNLHKIIKKSRFINRWIEKNIEKTEQRVILCNILSSVSEYLEVTKKSLNLHISVLALGTRSIYELNVRLRSVIGQDAEQKKWASEAVTDKVQTLEGILLLGSESENIISRSILTTEIERLRSLIVKYDMPVIKQPASTGNIAKTVGLENEHKALFKMYSKLVHPSSYLVNDYNNAASIENQKTLQIHAQLYAHDSIERICNVFAVPNNVSKPYGKAEHI